MVDLPAPLGPNKPNIIPDLIASEIANGKIQIAISYIGMDSHYNSLSRGVIDSRDIIYFLSLNIIFIQLTSHSISRKKW